ncbi:MAG: FkbM family methyltransferase, partial [Nanopusillaceae archaeon]
MDVIDIGMNIGDSSIYFSLNGAKRVIGLEPYPYAFSLANKNLKLNNINNVIILNAGYGKDSEIIIDADKISSNSSSLMASTKGIKIPILSLKTLFDQYKISNAVVKMDCEGCEFDLILNDYENIRKFENLIFEYHPKIAKKPIDILLNKLKKDYNIKIKGSKNLGIMYCNKK